MYQVQTVSRTDTAKAALEKFAEDSRPVVLVLFCLLAIAAYFATMYFGVVAVLWLALAAIPLYAIQVLLWCTRG